jgi:hypothetical protein
MMDKHEAMRTVLEAATMYWATDTRNQKLKEAIKIASEQTRSNYDAIQSHSYPLG